MFESLSGRLGEVFDRLRKRGALTEADVGEALREVRVALLEADVALQVVKDFIDRVRESAVGDEVLRSVTPGQMVIKIVHDELVAMLGEDSDGLNLRADAAGADPAGRAAGLGQDHDRRQDRAPAARTATRRRS